MKSEPEGKKKKDEDEEKIRPTQAAANLRPREPGRATRAVWGRAMQAARPGPRELFLSLSLIWSPSL